MSSGNKNEWLNERYMEAARAYCLGHFQEALVGFSELVHTGNAMAATYLANLYLRGEGVSPNIEKAIALLELAIRLGDSQAAYNLGALYRSGAAGVPIDANKSRSYFKLAKKLGCELSIDEFIQ